MRDFILYPGSVAHRPVLLSLICRSTHASVVYSLARLKIPFMVFISDKKSIEMTRRILLRDILIVPKCACPYRIPLAIMTDYRNPPYLLRMKPLWSIVLLLLAVSVSRADPTTTTTAGPTTVVTSTVAPESSQDPLKGSCALYCFITPEKVYGRRGESIVYKIELDSETTIIYVCLFAAEVTTVKLNRTLFYDT